jgi:hypothetical protein
VPFALDRRRVDYRDWSNDAGNSRIWTLRQKGEVVAQSRAEKYVMIEGIADSFVVCRRHEVGPELDEPQSFLEFGSMRTGIIGVVQDLRCKNKGDGKRRRGQPCMI